MEAKLLETAEELLLFVVEPVLVIPICSMQRKSTLRVFFPQYRALKHGHV